MLVFDNDPGRAEAVALADSGIDDAMTSGSLLLDTSSSEPWLTRQTAQWLAGRGVAMVDAPVSGAQWGAQAAEQQLYRAASLSVGPGRSVSEMVRWIEHLIGTEMTAGQGPADASRPTAGSTPRRQRKVPPAQ